MDKKTASKLLNLWTMVKSGPGKWTGESVTPQEIQKANETSLASELIGSMDQLQPLLEAAAGWKINEELPSPVFALTIEDPGCAYRYEAELDDPIVDIDVVEDAIHGVETALDDVAVSDESDVVEWTVTAAVTREVGRMAGDKQIRTAKTMHILCGPDNISVYEIALAVFKELGPPVPTGKSVATKSQGIN